MKTSNKVYIGTSIDGFIADKNGGLEWLDSIPNPDNSDMGYYAFMDSIDALLMGRVTFETVIGFDIEWPYKKPVYVLSNTLSEVPENLQGKVFLVKGALSEVLDEIHKNGHHHLYIDGGKLIQSFLREDRIDEMTITVIPIVLGDGIPLFGDLPASVMFECYETQHLLGKIAQNKFKRIRS